MQLDSRSPQVLGDVVHGLGSIVTGLTGGLGVVVGGLGDGLGGVVNGLGRILVIMFSEDAC
jgi:hypothetical protein